MKGRAARGGFRKDAPSYDARADAQASSRPPHSDRVDLLREVVGAPVVSGASASWPSRTNALSQAMQPNRVLICGDR